MEEGCSISLKKQVKVRKYPKEQGYIIIKNSGNGVNSNLPAGRLAIIK